jgi:hypothetical protein
VSVKRENHLQGVHGAPFFIPAPEHFFDPPAYPLLLQFCANIEIMILDATLDQYIARFFSLLSLFF